MISDLQTESWAVLSERGCEATHLTHEEARRLVHKLASEGHHGLCIVTNEAALRIAPRAQTKDLVGAGDRT
jgi:fructose-1-phosphate kinase PfkB-like protein